MHFNWSCPHCIRNTECPCSLFIKLWWLSLFASITLFNPLLVPRKQTYITQYSYKIFLHDWNNLSSEIATTNVKREKLTVTYWHLSQSNKPVKTKALAHTLNKQQMMDMFLCFSHSVQQQHCLQERSQHVGLTYYNETATLIIHSHGQSMDLDPRECILTVPPVLTTFHNIKIIWILVG